LGQRKSIEFGERPEGLAPALITIALAVMLAGCANHADLELKEASHLASGRDRATLDDDPGAKEDLRKAQASFSRKAYGLAEKHFRAAIEQDRNDAEAWLGLAASYDQLKRYDLADRAYDRLDILNVDRAVVLNNRGYSHILRGDYGRARKLLVEAQSIAPGDERIAHNLALLDTRNAGGHDVDGYK
jgi:Flp pilus assembly protein TadD